MTKQEIFEALAAPFPKEDIQFYAMRQSNDKKKGVPAFYVDARAVRRRLNEVVGPDGWHLDIESPQTGRVIARLTIDTIVETEDGLTDHLLIRRADGADETGEEPFKGGISQAFRRVAYTVGIGEYFYDTPELWLPMHKKGESGYYNHNGFKSDPRNRLPSSFFANGGGKKSAQKQYAETVTKMETEPQKPFSHRLREAGKGRNNDEIRKVYEAHGIKDGKVPKDLDGEKLIADIKALPKEDS